MAINDDETPLNPQNIKYLAFEGGGGKGIVYSGAIKVLERVDVGVLPITTGSVLGLSGASAGAITAFFLSLGMADGDISKEIDADVFADFYDNPAVGVYKAVKVKNGIVEVGYATDNYIIDDPEPTQTTRLNTLSGIPTLDTITEKDDATFKSIVIGNPEYFFKNKSKALLAGKNNFKTFSSFYGLGLVSLATKFMRLRAKSKKSENAFLAKFGEKRAYLSLYTYSLLMDRGLFTGFASREYLQKMAFVSLYDYYPNTTGFEQLNKEFQKVNKVPFSPPVKSNIKEEIKKRREYLSKFDYSFVSNILTFNLLNDITQKELFITATNLTQNKPVLFSCNDTPDFPVVEAVCCSMSIPSVFKPTYVNYFTPDGENYNGLYIDGGTLNNLPLHVWDDSTDSKLNPNVVGIRVTDGYDPTDKTYRNEDTWKAYFKDLKENVYKTKIEQDIYENRIKTFKDYGSRSNFMYTYDAKSAFTNLLKLLNDLFGTVLYPSEDGQIRTDEERSQTIEYFAYDVDMLNFSPQKDLKAFIIKRAEEKTKKRLNVTD